MRSVLRTIVVLSMALLLAACGGGQRSSTVLQGRILLWHSWSGTEAEMLDSLLERFHDIYPNIHVIAAPYPADELQAQFVDKVTQGLGPDLMIGEQMWIPELSASRLIQPISEEDIDASNYLAAALSTLRYQDELYGLPLSVQTSALYYNKRLVQSPPATLEALLEEAESGKKVALNTNFDAAFWGIQAFGGQLLDEDGRIVLDRGGFTSWLDWLSNAQNVPNIILSNDQETIESLFEEGEIAYYVDSSSELLRLQETLGEEVIGVAPLPAGPNASAGPFLETEPLFLSTASSPVQTRRALLLAEFLTNVEQQRKLAQQTGRIPANPHVRIDRRVSPSVASFVEQSKTAVPLLLIPQTFDAIEYGQEAYVQTLEGLVDSVEAAQRVTEQVNTNYGFEVAPIFPELACAATENAAENAGASSEPIEVWHGWSAGEAAALAQLSAAFAEQCSGQEIVLRALDASNLIGKYEEAVRTGEGPDLLLTSNRHVTQLASATLVGELDELVEPTFLQRYIPTVPNAMRYGDNLYGLPIAMDTMALYYNTDVVDAPPTDLGDLLNQVGPERQLAMPYTPYYKAHWGISAFGGELFDAAGNLTLAEGGFSEWLSWLRRARDRPGIILTQEEGEAQALFASGEAAYFVGEREALNALQAQMGSGHLGVAPLPAGPEGPSGPILDVEGFVLNPTLAPGRAASAMAFAKFAASLDSQMMLMETASIVPANINIAATTHPAVAGFHQQAKTAVIAPNRAEMEAILGLGNTIYENVLDRDADPATALDTFSLFVQNTYGTATAAGESVQPCQESGELLLWHSETGLSEEVLSQLVADFARECPDVTVQTVYVPAEELPRRLALASQALLAPDAAEPSADDAAADSVDGETGAAPPNAADEASGTTAETAPDLFLAPHDLIMPLSAERLLKPVTPWVTDATLIPLQPKAVSALHYADALYGLPYAVETMALYYNADMISDTVDSLADSTLTELFAAASPDAPLALDTSFEGAFWGVLAFGRSAMEANAEQVETGDLHLEQTGLVEWLSWLQTASQQQGIIMDNDPAKLQEMFAAGNAAYLVAGPGALASLRGELEAGERLSSTVNVAPLPAGPEGSASPFLRVNSFLFSAAASEAQTRLALRFAEFAVGTSSQEALITDANLAPANLLASLRVGDPNIESFLTQAKSSLPLPPRPEAQVLFDDGDELYENVLQEGRDPAQEVSKFIERVAQAAKPPVIAYAGYEVLACASGTLRFGYSWPFAPETNAGETLDAILAEFSEYCPGMEIHAIYAEPEDLMAAIGTENGPDLFLAPHYLAVPLAENGSIRPITGLVHNPEDTYLPKAVRALTHNDELYGLPQTMDVEALYYNAALVSNPASTLETLWETVGADAPVVMDSSFAGTYWGVSAFGGELFDGQGQLILDQEPYVAWLTWLRDAQEHPGVLLSREQDERLQRFARGDAAYLIAGPAALAPLRQRLDGSVRVVPLPEGPAGPAGPLLRVDAFMFSAAMEDAMVEPALTLAGFIASQNNQTRLRREANLVPANRAAAETVDDSAIATFIRQATDTAVLLPGVHEMNMLAAGDRIYTELLTGTLEPAEAMNAVVEVVQLPEDPVTVPATGS